MSSSTAPSLHTTLGQTAEANDLRFTWDSFSAGERQGAGEPLFLIMGIGAQRIFWPDGLCRALATRGFHVVRFDNRDVGQSSRLDHLPTPGVLETLSALAAGRPVPAPYTLDHMADDVAALIQVLGFDSAHVCGASMGGMIAQTVAFRHPERLRSLVSIMSTTGNPSLPPPDPEAMRVLTAPNPVDPEAYANHTVDVWRTIGSPGFPFDAEGVRERARLAYERGLSPRGFVRQLAAILAHGDRRARLAAVRAPTLVIHGGADGLVPPAGGRDTVRSIPGAEWMLIEGMGHDFPKGVWDRIADAIRRNADRADGS